MKSHHLILPFLAPPFALCKPKDRQVRVGAAVPRFSKNPIPMKDPIPMKHLLPAAALLLSSLAFSPCAFAADDV